MADQPPLIFERQFGKLIPVNAAAQQAMLALGEGKRTVVKLSGMTRNQRRRGFYWTLLDVVSDVLTDRTKTPWDSQTLHDELRHRLKLYVPLETPSGRKVPKLKSTSDKSMNEVERAAWTNRVVNYLEHMTGIEAHVLIDEVKSHGFEPELKEVA